MLAVVKAPMAKIGDVFGRMEAFLLSILLYVAGYLQMALSNTVQVYAVLNLEIVQKLMFRVPSYSTLQG